MEEGARLGGEGSDEKWQGWFGLGKTVLGPRREASQTHQIYWDREHTHIHTHWISMATACAILFLPWDTAFLHFCPTCELS